MNFSPSAIFRCSSHNFYLAHSSTGTYISIFFTHVWTIFSRYNQGLNNLYRQSIPLPLVNKTKRRTTKKQQNQAPTIILQKQSQQVFSSGRTRHSKLTVLGASSRARYTSHNHAEIHNTFPNPPAPAPIFAYIKHPGPIKFEPGE